jgi:putative alpha-1,2-mannosidase
VRCIGRRARRRPALDAFFATAPLLRIRSAPRRSAGSSIPTTTTARVTYNPNNEPDLHAPFLYAWTGQPWKTATVVRAAQSLFTHGPGGRARGNDDLGTMSAWYVLTSLGLYPTTSGAGFFALRHAAVPPAPSSGSGPCAAARRGALTIDAPRTTDSKRYTASVTLDGRAVRRTWLTRAAVVHGGHLVFAVSPRPTRWGTGSAAAPPSIAAWRMTWPLTLATAGTRRPSSRPGRPVRIEPQLSGRCQRTIHVGRCGEASRRRSRAGRVGERSDHEAQEYGYGRAGRRVEDVARAYMT